MEKGILFGLRQMVLTFLVLFPVLAVGMDQSGELSVAAKSDFEWFSSLGFPDTKGCRFVRVATGHWRKDKDGKRNNWYVTGFLLAEKGDVFNVFTRGLEEHEFKKTGPQTAEHERVDFEVVDLKTELDSIIQKLRQSDGKERGAYLAERSLGRATLLMLAWGGWRQGLGSEAGQLYQLVSKMPGNIEKEEPFREGVGNDIAHTMIWRVMMDFSDLRVSRSQLLQKLRILVKNFHKSEHYALAKAMAEVLEKMVVEDVAHAKKAVQPLDQLPLRERVDELIFQLRDQNGHQVSQPGSCDIFLDIQGRTNTPAHQLVAIGSPAVPQLIGDLEDSRLSRSVGFHRNFYFSHHVLDVGDCTRAILERIAGREFRSKEDVEAWWSTFQSKGEKQMLIDGTVVGDRNSPGQARLLAQRYPEAAADAVLRGIKACDNKYVRPMLLRVLGEIDDLRCVEFLKTEMRTGASVLFRVVAASALLKKNKSEAVRCIIHGWEMFLEEDEPSGSDDVRYVLQFLAGCDSAEAIQALERGFGRLTAGLKEELVEVVGDPRRNLLDPEKPRVDSEETLLAIEQLLVVALGDGGRNFHSTGGCYEYQGVEYTDPRICDRAGTLLAQRWPTRYQFDPTATRLTRDRQCVECQNVWRKVHRLPELPLPVPRNPRLASMEVNKVTSIVWAKDSVLPSGFVAAAVEAINQKSLQPSELVRVFTAYVSAPVFGTRGMEVEVTRDEDCAGISIHLRLVPIRIKYPQLSRDWSMVLNVSKGRESVYGGCHSGDNKDYCVEAKDWADLAKSADVVLSAPETVPFCIRVSISR